MLIFKQTMMISDLNLVTSLLLMEVQLVGKVPNRTL